MGSYTITEYKPRGACKDLFYCTDEAVLLEGPAGCNSFHTLMLDALTGKQTPIGELCRQNIRPHVMTLNGPVRAGVPFRKGRTRLYRVVLSDGTSTVVTSDHRFLGRSGWVTLNRISPGDELLRGDSHGRHSVRTGTGYLDRCSIDRDQYGGQPRSLEGIGQSSVPSQDDVVEHSFAYSSVDDPDSRSLCSHPDPLMPHPSKMSSSFPLSGGPLGVNQDQLISMVDAGHCVSSEIDGHFLDLSRLPLPSIRSFLHASPYRQASFDAYGQPLHAPLSALSQHDVECEEPSSMCGLSARILESCASALDTGKQSLFAALQSNVFQASCHYKAHWRTVKSIKYVGVDDYFDLHVPGEEHYLADGIWSHNTGKSLAGLQKMKLLCNTFENIRCLLVRKTRSSMSETTLATWENHVCPRDLIKGDASRHNRAFYSMPRNNRVVLGGMDNPDRIMSADYDFIMGDEATEFTIEDYEKLTTRLRNGQMPYQQGIFPCNPGMPGHFLNKKAKKGEMTRLKSLHTDNPTLYDDNGEPTERGEKYIAKLGRLTGSRKQQYFLGIWSAADNLVYEAWDPKIHVVNEYKDPIKYYIAGSDWGYVDPGTYQVWGVDYEGRSVCVHQTYRSGKHMDFWRELARRIQKKYYPKRWVCDHDVEKIQQLTRIGIPAMRAKKDIDMGISVVNSRLSIQDDGRPKLCFLADSLKNPQQELKDEGVPARAEEEFWYYAYDKERSDRNQKEIPVDYMNHGMDLMRYINVYIDKFFHKRLY